MPYVLQNEPSGRYFMGSIKNSIVTTDNLKNANTFTSKTEALRCQDFLRNSGYKFKVIKKVGE